MEMFTSVSSKIKNNFWIVKIIIYICTPVKEIKLGAVVQFG